VIDPRLADLAPALEEVVENGGRHPQPPPYTDTGNAERFAAAHADRLRYLRERGHWIVWRDGRWRKDTTGDAERAAKAVARSLYADASQLDGEEAKKAAQWGLTSQAEPRIRAQLSLAGSEPDVVISAGQLDGDPYLLACSNGVLDLRTSELRPARPDDLISLGTDIPYRPSAGCPRWLNFLGEVFGGDEELIAFLRRFVGYCLTGDVREHVLAVFHGSGANGKSTLIGVLRHLLGDLAVTAAFDTFMRQRDRGPRNDLARLHRARLVTAAESGEGRRLDEATVKEITGGDVIAARFLYGEHFEFTPQFKLVLVTNHPPKVDGDDDAIWRRLRLVPFEQSFEGREERDLTDTLEAELPGILAWAVRGCLEWQEEGLGEASAITRATADYRADEDVLGAFLAERCVLHGESSTRELRAAYEAYCADVGERPLGAKALGKRLAKREIRRSRRSSGSEHVYGGVSLRCP
jgi:putative DNA primase/helicase